MVIATAPRSPRGKEEAVAAFEGQDALQQLVCPWACAGSDRRKLKVGDIAPDSNVVTLVEEKDGEETNVKPSTTPTNLHSILQKDSSKPTVLVFGSMTCPSFRSLFLKEIVDIIREQKGAVRLVVVYLAEAYPKDGDWHHHNTNNHNGMQKQQHQQETASTAVADDIHTHKTIEDRVNAAQLLLKLYDPRHLEELVVDTMDDDTDKHYHAQPSRIYVIDQQQKIVYTSDDKGAKGPNPFRISPSSLQAFLWEYQSNNGTNNTKVEGDQEEEET